MNTCPTCPHGRGFNCLTCWPKDRSATPNTVAAPVIKTAYDLKYAVEAANPNSNFFTRNNMKFSGDTMRNYGVNRTTITANYDTAGEYHPEGTPCGVYELYRRKPTKHGLAASAYFCAVTLRQVHMFRGGKP